MHARCPGRSPSTHEPPRARSSAASSAGRASCRPGCRGCAPAPTACCVRRRASSTAPGTRGSRPRCRCAPRSSTRGRCCARRTSRPLAFPRTVLVIHDAAVLRHPAWYSPAYAAWQRRLLPAVARRALHVVTVSEFSRGELVELLGLAPERVSVIPGGVGPAFTPAADPEPARRAHGLRRPYVLCVASQLARKNLGALVPAAAQLAAEGIEVVVAGGHRPQFAREGELAGVRLLGPVDDRLLPGLYAGAEAFVLPSLHEGFGLCVLEAMASGVPVVAADAGALPETAGGAAPPRRPPAGAAPHGAHRRCSATLPSRRACAPPASSAPARSPGTAPRSWSTPCWPRWRRRREAVRGRVCGLAHHSGAVLNTPPDPTPLDAAVRPSVGSGECPPMSSGQPPSSCSGTSSSSSRSRRSPRCSRTTCRGRASASRCSCSRSSGGRGRRSCG